MNARFDIVIASKLYLSPRVLQCKGCKECFECKLPPNWQGIKQHDSSCKASLPAKEEDVDLEQEQDEGSLRKQRKAVQSLN